MKNIKMNAGSLAIAKLQTMSRKLIVIALVAIIGFSMIACDDGSSGGSGGSGGGGNTTKTLTSISALRTWLEGQPDIPPLPLIMLR